MIRSMHQILLLVLIAFAALVSVAPAAHAGPTVSGIIGGEELFPSAARNVRKARTWRAEVQQYWEHAHRIGDWRAIEAIRREAERVNYHERQALERLREATTRVTVYGDAASRETRQMIIADLARNHSWQHAHVHVWYENGQKRWSTFPPRRYDDRDRASSTPRGTAGSKPRPSGKHKPVYGHVIKVGNIGAAPLAPEHLERAAKRNGKAKSKPRTGSASGSARKRRGKVDRTAGTLYGLP